MKMKKNQAFCEIVRETSAYNKYIKWFVRTYLRDMTLVSSCGYSTKRQAEEHIETMIKIGREGFQIGDHLSYTEYTCIGAQPLTLLKKKGEKNG